MADGASRMTQLLEYASVVGSVSLRPCLSLLVKMRFRVSAASQQKRVGCNADHIAPAYRRDQVPPAREQGLLLGLPRHIRPSARERSGGEG